MSHRRYYSNLSTISWKGRTEILSKKVEMKKAIQYILQNGENCLGFDVEFDATPTPALVQVATAAKVYLFRICRLQGSKLDPLLPLLTSESITKVGVGIGGDVASLQRLQDFDDKGFVEVNSFVDRDAIAIKSTSLKSYSAYYLPGYLSKKRPGGEPWDAVDLSEEQIRYAATDAWASREVYVRVVAEAEVEYMRAIYNRDFCSNFSVGTYPEYGGVAKESGNQQRKPEDAAKPLSVGCSNGNPEALQRNKLYKCPTCGKAFATAEGLDNHKRAKHSLFHCSQCKSVFKSLKKF